MLASKGISWKILHSNPFHQGKTGWGQQLSRDSLWAVRRTLWVPREGLKFQPMLAPSNRREKETADLKSCPQSQATEVEKSTEAFPKQRIEGRTSKRNPCLSCSRWKIIFFSLIISTDGHRQEHSEKWKCKALSEEEKNDWYEENLHHCMEYSILHRFLLKVQDWAKGLSLRVGALSLRVRRGEGDGAESAQQQALGILQNTGDRVSAYPFRYNTIISYRLPGAFWLRHRCRNI